VELQVLFEKFQYIPSASQSLVFVGGVSMQVLLEKFQNISATSQSSSVGGGEHTPW
jgi:hypothetical protein